MRSSGFSGTIPSSGRRPGCWEIAIKTGLGKLRLGEPALTFLTRAIPASNFDLLPIALEHAALVDTLPFHHRDPFDRLLVAQVLTEKIAPVSADPVLDGYGVVRRW